jgi:BMFP domain-containing protein YqiC
MKNLDALNTLSSKIKELTKDSPLSDANKNMHALFKGTLTKMELVTREEFDVQTEVLRNTQAKLTALEEKLAQLEALLETNE